MNTHLFVWCYYEEVCIAVGRINDQESAHPINQGD